MARTIALTLKQRERIKDIHVLKKDGMSNVAIGKQLGINESTVRYWIKVRNKMSREALDAVSNIVEEARKDIETQIGFLDEIHHLFGEGSTIKMLPEIREDGYRIPFKSLSLDPHEQEIRYELNVMFRISSPTDGL